MRPPIHLALALVAAGAPHALAEGRSDAFLRCTFDGAVVVLAEAGGSIVWREGDVHTPAACLGQGNDLAQCIAETDPPSALVLATGVGALPFGPARLTRTTAGAGLPQAASDGTCEALTP